MDIDKMIEDCLFSGNISEVYDQWVLRGSEGSFEDFCLSYSGLIPGAFMDDHDYSSVMNKLK